VSVRILEEIVHGEEYRDKVRYISRCLGTSELKTEEQKN
jgi:hypothetical protein